MNKIRTAIAKWLAPELAETKDRYDRLIANMQDDYWWLGEFPDAAETIRYLLDSHRNRYRAIGEKPFGNLPDDIGSFREHLRHRAAAPAAQRASKEGSDAS